MKSQSCKVLVVSARNMADTILAVRIVFVLAGADVCLQVFPG